MLETQERQLFLEALKAPPGYNIDRIIGTSYSLDLLAMLTVPLSFTLADWQDEQGIPRLDPLVLLEAMRRYAGKLTLFCQAGLIQVPRRHRPVYAYIEPCIIEVNAPAEEGVFHPKVWVCRYTSAEQPIHYKVVVQSRNLTFDRSWDVMLVLDGTLEARKNAYSQNHPLGSFIQALPDMAVRQVSEDVRSAIELVQYELRRVQFDIPAPFESMQFWPLGIQGYKGSPFIERMDRTLVISPFVSGPFLQKLGEKGSNHLLVTREESFADLQPEQLAKFKTIYVLHESGFPEPVDAGNDGEKSGHDSDLEDDIFSSQHEGLHAKVYVSDAGWDASVWIGSANATVHGFEKNVEFMVQLKGKKSRCGVDAVLGNPEQKGSLIRILREHMLPESGETEDEIEQRQVEKRLEAIRKRICSADFSIHVESAKELFRLDLHLPEDMEDIPADALIRCWPISMREAAVATQLSFGQHASQTGVYESVSFGPVEATAITSFMAFEIILPHQNKLESVRFLCNFPLIGAPEDRLDLLLRGLLKNRDELLRYLMMLLGDGGFDALSMDVLLEEGKKGTGSAESQSNSSFPLFEALMKTLYRNPSQLDSIADLIESLSKSEEGLSLLPDGFMDMWGPIWKVRKGLTV